MDDLVVIVVVHDEASRLVVAAGAEGGEVRDVAIADVNVPVNLARVIDEISFFVVMSVDISTPGPRGLHLLLNLGERKGLDMIEEKKGKKKRRKEESQRTERTQFVFPF